MQIAGETLSVTHALSISTTDACPPSCRKFAQLAALFFL